MIGRIVVVLAVLAASIAGLPASAAEALFPIGSRIGFVPPPGFQVSKRFPGFENPDDGGSMIVLTVPPQAVGEIEIIADARDGEAPGRYRGRARNPPSH